MISQVKTSLSPRQAAKEILRRRIETMQWEAGQVLPSESKLADELGYSKPSINRALQELQKEGLVVSEPGSRKRYVRKLHSHFRHGLIGVLHFDRTALSHPVMQQRINGIEEVLRDHGLRMRIEAGDHYHAEYEPLPASDRLNELGHGLDGLIVHWCHTDFTPLTRVSALLPVIIIENISMGPRVGGICCDHELSHFQLTNSLLQAGHNHIGRLGLAKSMWPGRPQATGMRVAARNHYRSEQIAITDIPVNHNEIVQGKKAINRLIENDRLPTGLVCASDELAQGSLEALEAAGLQVPNDISVVCFGGEEPAVEMSCRLTSARIDFVELGRMTARRLLQLIDSNADSSPVADWPETIYLSPRLIDGDSIAPPPLEVAGRADGVRKNQLKEIKQGGVALCND